MLIVIFACVQSAGRSQMAAAFFNNAADPGRAVAISAGTRPAARVHPEVVTAMAEAGLDLTSAVPRLLTPDLATTARFLITMGCGDECPVAPGARREDWSFADPAGQSLEAVRTIRDAIRDRVLTFIGANGFGDPAAR